MMPVTDMQRHFLRFTGIAGIIGAICWIIGDMLIVGSHATPDEYPLLLQRYAGAIDFGGLSSMLPASEPRLAAGALIANFAIPFYLAASCHLYVVARPAGRVLATLVFLLMLCGNAYSPLAHGAFYFVGMVYKAMLNVPQEAYPAFLELGQQFNRVLLIAYLAADILLFCGMALLAVITARGYSLYPRWFAAIINPVTLLLVAHVLPHLAPHPVCSWLNGAGINIAFLLAYGLSTFYLWKERGVQRAFTIPPSVAA
ncbi:DUF6796 family protein [Dongia soli]|uniref:DUF6796 family protein n=1 Tax=Dongia soli TaxID=600628 RepID=A0ABU5EED6_9PROT|nr:DUF6796 family protein [Dongia soli]MDY0884588.1 DUF6796 family protein [Dongia soli]